MNIHNSIKNGIEYLKNEQNSDGSFFGFSTADADDFTRAKTYQPIFTSALILSALNELDENSTLKAVKSGLAEFLCKNKSDHWSFNYWARDSKEARLLPYPDDLDDTFCALAALQKYDPEIIDGQALAMIVALLTAVESKEGGPYRTWLVPATEDRVWQDIDLAVNSNVAYFLSLNDVELPNIVIMAEDSIDQKKFTSPYYPTPWPIIYFISRFYRGRKKNALIDYILKNKKENGSWNENSLDTALAISSLANLGEALKPHRNSVDFILSAQANGAWPAQAFCIDPAIDGQTHFSGARALTGAFCLEALFKFISAANSTKTIHVDEKQIGIYEKIIADTKKMFPADTEKISLPVLEKMIRADQDKQVVLLPYYFYQCLSEKNKIDDSDIVKLGVANLLGWTAYTVFDDFLDDEGDPRLLPTGTLCLRELTGIYLKLSEKNKQIAEIFHETMKNLDNANSWEIQNCRALVVDATLHIPDQLPDFQDYSKLAERSLGHALGPVAILLLQGFEKESPEIRNLMEFFKHYIIAKQLNDDAHDWEDDLKKGHISATGAFLLSAWREKVPKRSINIKAQLPALQEIFWTQTIISSCDEILVHVAAARRALDEMNFLSDKSSMSELIAPHERSAQQAMETQKKTLEFIKTYQSQ
ncbi:MAG: hypothetical protein ACOZBH_03100 [Patescibacteria group bacterium]